MISLEEPFIINSTKFISSGLGDEIMLMNLETGDYVGLNPVSADIYKQAEEKTTAKQVIDILLQKYDVEEDVCRAQVLTCINEMEEKDLIVKL